MAEQYCIATNSLILNEFSRYLYSRCGLGEVSVSNHVGTIRRLMPLLGPEPTHPDIDAHIAKMRKSGASYAHITNTSVAIERYMEFRGNPIKLGRPRKPRRLIRGTMSESEVTLLIAAAKNLRERAMLSLLAYSGIRNRELCNLTVVDVDIANQIVRVHSTKTGKDRNCAIAGACVAVLIDYLRERNGQADDYLFVTLRGSRQYTPQDLRKLVRSRALKAGIHKRVYPHLFRHSLATNLLNRGAHLMVIKEQLGHAFIDTTMIYLHSVPERLQMSYRMFAPSYM